MLQKPTPIVRFIYFEKRPPEGEAGNADRQPQEPEKAKVIEQAKDAGKKLDTEITQKLEDPLKQFSPKFLAEIVKEVPSDELEKIRQAAESDAVTLSDLKGGHDWLGVSEQDYEQKYYKLSQAYLTKVEDASGRTVFKVKEELNRHDKVKFGLGAGDMLPPSILVASITDLNGTTRTGARQIGPDGRVGYYDSEGYIPVFAGYSIAYGKTQTDFIAEDSNEYKKQIEAEKQNYKERKANEQAYLDGTGRTPAEVQSYAGRVDHPVSNLNTLRTITPEQAAAKLDYLKQADRERAIAEIGVAQQDMFRVEAIVSRLGLRPDLRMEQDGGSVYLGFNGQAAAILGWNADMNKAEVELNKKLTDQEYLKEAVKDLKDGEKKDLPEEVTIVKDEKSPDGYYLQTKLGHKITNLKAWTAEQVAKKYYQPNTPTAALLKALGTGGQLIEGSDIKVQGGYTFNIAHLRAIHNAAQHPAKLAEIIKKLPLQNGRINSTALIQALATPEGYENLKTTGMSLAEAQAYASRLGLHNLLGNGSQSLERLMGMSRKKQPFTINNGYQFAALGNHLNFPVGNGVKCCAWTSSTFLGLGASPESVGKGKEGNVSGLLSKIIRSNIERQGNPGFVMGFENMQMGDTLAFGMNKNGESYLGHVAVIRDRFMIDGVEYLAIQHDQEHIQINLVPVSRSSNGRATRLNKALANPASRQQYLAQYPQLAAIYQYREKYPNTVNVRANAGWYGDATKGGGNILFAVRTAGLLREAPVSTNYALA